MSPPAPPRPDPRFLRRRIGTCVAVAASLLGPGLIGGLGMGLGLIVAGLDRPLRAAPLPFDPLPSAFEAWLNGRGGWPDGAELTFSRLSSCFERSANGSPYSSPLYQCLAGTVTIRDAGGRRTCQLSQVLFLPSTNQVRYRTLTCR